MSCCATCLHQSESSASTSLPVAQVLEKKKILSTAANLGILSAADKAGFNLAKVEDISRVAAHMRLSLCTRCSTCA